MDAKPGPSPNASVAGVFGRGLRLGLPQHGQWGEDRGTVVLQTQCQDARAKAWHAGHIEGQLVVESGLPNLKSGSLVQARSFDPTAYQLAWPEGMDASQVQRVAGSWRSGPP